MASGPLVGSSGSGGGGGNGSSREKHRWAESKVYTRKSHKSSSKQNPSSQPQNQEAQTLVPTSSAGDPRNSLRNQPQPYSVVGSDGDVSSLNINHERNDGSVVAGVLANESNGKPLVSYSIGDSGQQCLLINVPGGSKEEIRELKFSLAKDLEKVRTYFSKIESLEAQLSVAAAVAVSHANHSQLSCTDGSSVSRQPFSGGSSRKMVMISEAGTDRRQQLTVSVVSGQMESHSMSDATEREKRTPKANQYYRNSDFLLAKDKIPTPVSSKKSKANGNKTVAVFGHGNYGVVDYGKVYTQAFKSCATLLSRLMKHKHGWVFNKPVDVKLLGLHDYNSIIKSPMDLGTVNTRLTSNWYKSPKEFAEDVRLTFRNAMTYNPRGQDVYAMAEILSGVFEEQWHVIEAEFTRPPSYSFPPKKVPPPLDMRRILERSESTTHPVVPESIPRSLSYTPHSVRAPALKKPKAKDPNKREMTHDEKQKLSNQLQSLPNEKLDLIVQIIKKRNTSMSQHDDEIEVDIDSVDTETLWELDRFVTNYKKSLSKHRRRAELAMQARQQKEQNIPILRNQESVAVEKPMENKTDKQRVSSSSPIQDEKKGGNESRSSRSSSSSSDSGSSSSDSDSESSSG